MFNIGDIQFPAEPLFLAPMEDVSDPPFRYLCKQYGADMMYTEFISHFIQVANFAIQRGDFPVSTRDYYGLDENEKKIPQLNSDKDILEWGNQIIKGEAQRVSKGLTPITNPTIALVKVHFEKFQKANETQSILLEASKTAQEKLKDKRAEADDLIVRIWNEVEDNLSKLPPHEKRKHAEDYGLVYVFRKHEKEFAERVNS